MEDALNFWKAFLQGEGCTQVEYFYRGHRGLIFTALYQGEKIGIKVPRPSSDVPQRIRMEAENLLRVNALGIGPRLIKAGYHGDLPYLFYRFVEGETIGDALPHLSSSAWKRVKQEVFSQMITLDRAGLSKEEMHHPLKHVIIGEDHVTLLDFERMHADPSPGNLTQWVHFMTCALVRRYHEEPSIAEVLSLIQRYKNGGRKEEAIVELKAAFDID